MPEDEESEQEQVDFEGVSAETESDLGLTQADSLEAVVVSTDWTAETLLNQIARGNIGLDPEFQRRDAWTTTRKSRFIESLIVGLPVPQLVLAERPKKRGSFIVLDGKQRLLTLTQFAADEDDEPLKLRRLELRSDLNGSDYDSLPPEDRAAFDNQTIRTIVVRNWKSDAFLFAVFLRLNTGNLPLSPQELRQALHPGPFLRFASRLTSDSPAFREMLNLTKPDFRMRDVELLVRFFAFERFLPTYTGNLKPLLDRTCEQLNEDWSTHEGDIRQAATSCEAAITATLGLFGEHAFRRWSSERGRYERPFNRAVFDIMAFYFSDAQARDSAQARGPEEVEAAFRNLCTEQRFNEALSTTTKSIEAIQFRLERWGQALTDLGVQVSAPVIDAGSIRYTR